jgi:hypothetical protein
MHMALQEPGVRGRAPNIFLLCSHRQSSHFRVFRSQPHSSRLCNQVRYAARFAVVCSRLNIVER